jgi:hypothetical protein
LRRVLAGMFACATLMVASSPAVAASAGSVDDPRGDASPGRTAAYFTDVRTVGLSYDADAGTLQGQVLFWDTSAPGGFGAYPWFHFYADVGFAQEGGCDSTAVGGVSMHFHTPDDAPVAPTPPDAHVVGGPTIAGTFEPIAAGWSFRFEDPALVRRGYACATRIRVENLNGALDTVAGFCLGTCAPASAPVTPTNLRATVAGDGVHLAWDPSPDRRFAYFAVRRGTQPDPDAGSWTRLPGNFRDPAATDVLPNPGTYFYYVTEVDADGRVSDRSNVVRVVIASDAPPATPSPAPSPTPGPPPPPPAPAGGVRGAHVVHVPAANRRQRTVSRAQARTVAGRALRRTAGRSFRRGSQRRMSCQRRSSTRWSCRVSWRYRDRTYRARAVIVFARTRGYTITVEVRRR